MANLIVASEGRDDRVQIFARVAEALKQIVTEHKAVDFVAEHFLIPSLEKYNEKDIYTVMMFLAYDNYKYYRGEKPDGMHGLLQGKPKDEPT